uniref:Protein kinase domain-containing protein n=1 Tax=Steinernema glaseri TaxID=37863 RepID=A0A1I7YKU9_9BILA
MAGYDYSADFFSAGCVIFEFATGEHFFKDVEEVEQLVRFRPAPPSLPVSVQEGSFCSASREQEHMFRPTVYKAALETVKEENSPRAIPTVFGDLFEAEEDYGFKRWNYSTPGQILETYGPGCQLTANSLFRYLLLK